MINDEFKEYYFDLFPQCILILDREGKIVFVNNSLKEWLEYEKEYVLGKSALQLPIIKSSCFPEMKRNLRRRLSGEEIPPYEIELFKRSGESAFAEVTGTIIPGEQPYVIIILRDVTEEKKMLQALRKSEREYRFLFEESPVSLWEEDLSAIKKYVENLKGQGISDLEKHFEENPAELDKCISMIKILKVNKAGLEIYDGKRKEEIPEKLEDTFIEESYKPFRDSIIAISEGKQRFQVKVWRSSLTGRKRLLSLRLIVAPGYEENYGKVLISIVDITENRRIEEKLAKADKLESLGILAGGIAHDFNNILAAIMGNISLAGIEAVNPDVKELLKEAENATERAKNLTQQLLTFSKGGEPILKPANLQEIVEEVTIFSLHGSNAKCTFEFDQDLEFVRVDEGQISQVINNLVMNASQAMPEGGTISIHGRNVNASDIHFIPDENVNYVEVGIKDAGVGIEPEIIGKIFDPFFSTKEKGNGLGLSSCYSIIKRHGGYVDVKSEPGKGAEFLIYLPACQKSKGQPKPIPKRARRGKGCILAIDDDEAIRNLYKITLERLGYEVELASNGREGLEKYQRGFRDKHAFDAAIIDLTIPGESGGGEILKNIKSIDPDVKAIVASGYHDNPVVAYFEEHGFADRISKPFTVSQLSQVISKVLGEASR